MRLIKIILLLFASFIFLGCENKRKVELLERLKQIEQYTNKPLDYTNLDEIRKHIGEEIFVQGYINEIINYRYTKVFLEESGGYSAFILFSETKRDISNYIKAECDAGCFIRIKAKVFDHRDGLYLKPIEVIEIYSMKLKKETEKELNNFK